MDVQLFGTSREGPLDVGWKSRSHTLKSDIIEKKENASKWRSELNSSFF